MFVKCKNSPPVEWPEEAYQLIMREDLALQAKIAKEIHDKTDYMEG